MNATVEHKSQFIWSNECQAVFGILISRRTSKPNLAYPDFNLPFVPHPNTWRCQQWGPSRSSRVPEARRGQDNLVQRRNWPKERKKRTWKKKTTTTKKNRRWINRAVLCNRLRFQSLAFHRRSFQSQMLEVTPNRRVGACRVGPARRKRVNIRRCAQISILIQIFVCYRIIKWHVLHIGVCWQSEALQNEF